MSERATRHLVVMPAGYRAVTSPLLDRVVVVDVDEANPVTAGAALRQAWTEAVDVAVAAAAARIEGGDRP